MAGVPLDRNTRSVTKRDACLAQIHGAIEHLWKGEYECAITLAGAAEGQIDTGGPDTFWERLKAKVPKEEEKEWTATFNAHRDWLKHNTLQFPDSIEIGEFEAVVFTVRAITKFNGKFKETSRPISDFAKWCVREGYFSENPMGGKSSVAAPPS
jgi:hypothetical protein